MSTTLLKPETVERKWYVIDAAGKPLGRVAAKAAVLLRIFYDLFQRSVIGITHDGIARNPDPAVSQNLHQLDHVQLGTVPVADFDCTFQERSILQQLRCDCIIRYMVLYAAVRFEDHVDQFCGQHE